MPAAGCVASPGGALGAAELDASPNSSFDKTVSLLLPNLSSSACVAGTAVMPRRSPWVQKAPSQETGNRDRQGQRKGARGTALWQGKHVVEASIGGHAPAQLCTA